jgi:gliding motility-associated-like protein
MKRIFYFLLFVFTFSFSFSQAPFWTEGFGVGCNALTVVSGFNSGNGAWSSTFLVPASSGSNEFYVSATENGNPVNSCGSGCGSNQTLHLANSSSSSAFACTAGDCGAAYNAAVGSDVRAESPSISTIGRSNIILGFDYLLFGQGAIDDGSVYYRVGAGPWNFLSTPPKTACGNAGCTGTAVCSGFNQGWWSSYSVALPATCNNQAGIQLGFRWVNNADNIGTDPSYAIDNVTLKVLATFTPQFVLPTPICSGGSVNVTATPNPGTVALTGYTWSSSPAGAVIGSPNAGSTSITFPTAGTYSITILASAASGTGTSTQTILVNPTPTVNVVASSTIVCPGVQATLTANGATSYAWSPGTGLSSTSGAVVTSSPSSTTNYTVTGTSAGCTNTAVVTVSVVPALAITVSGAFTICPGGSTTLTASGATNYTWSPGTGLSSTSSPTVIASPTFNQTYVIIGQDPVSGCTGTTSANVFIGTPLTVSVTPSSGTTCIGAPCVNLSATGASQYTWSPSTGLNTTFGPNVCATPSTSTQYTVFGATGTCTGQAVVNLTVTPPPTLTVTPTNTIICVGQAYTFTASGVGATGTYTWAPAFTLSNITGYTNTASPTITTTYTVFGQTSQGCLSIPKVITLTVVPVPTQTVSLTTNTLGIPGNSVCVSNTTNNPTQTSLPTITLTINNSTPPVGMSYNYTWTPNGPAVGNVSPPSGNIGSNAPTTVIAQPSMNICSGDYLITYTCQMSYANIPSCLSKVDTVTVRLVNCFPPVASFTTGIPNDTVCTHGCLTFINTTCGGQPQSVHWYTYGGNPDTSSTNFHVSCYNTPGDYTVALAVTNPYGYDSIIKTKFIHVVDTPNTYGVRDTCIRYGQSVQLFGMQANYYTWNPPTALSCTACPSPIANPTVTTNYVVTGYNSKKCKYNDTLQVCVVQDCGEMFVPNAFSPNLDGINDVLYVKGKCLKNLTFMIFNRWGEKVFETSDQKLGWDGTFNGELMNTAVFVYRLEGTTFDGNNYSSKGNITLIR